MSSHPTRLERHAWRRRQGIPTLSVLVGDRREAEEAWSRFREPESIVRKTPLDPFREWLRRLLTDNDWPALLARLDGRYVFDPIEGAARLRTKGRAELELFLQGRSAALSGLPVVRLLDWIEAAGRSLAELEGQLSREESEIVRQAIRSLGQLEGIQRPALLWIPPMQAIWKAHLDLLAELATEVPAADLGIQVAGEALNAWLVGPDTRLRAMVREGRIDLAESVAQPISVPPELARETRELLKRWGSTGEVIACFEAAAAATAEARGSEEEDARERARSAAEAFLFRLLAMLPDTAGRFELNGCVELPGEAHPREIDLIDRRGFIAIEIDGYYHFQDPDAYRRDRRKDLALQRGGFLVLRFLADDVVVRLETVLATIREALPNGRPRDVVAKR